MPYWFSFFKAPPKINHRKLIEIPMRKKIFIKICGNFWKRTRETENFDTKKKKIKNKPSSLQKFMKNRTSSNIHKRPTKAATKNKENLPCKAKIMEKPNSPTELLAHQRPIFNYTFSGNSIWSRWLRRAMETLLLKRLERIPTPRQRRGMRIVDNRTSQ